MIKRTEEITLMMTQEDYLLLQQLAEHLGVSMSRAVEYAILLAISKIQTESK